MSVARYLLSLGALAIVACSGKALDVGSNEGGPPAASGSGGSSGEDAAGAADGQTRQSAQSGAAPATTLAATPGSELVGVWQGYVESFQFPSGSDAVRLVFTAGPDGAVSGTVTFGDEPAPPPATSGDVGYPPGIADGGLGPQGAIPWEGFVYTALRMSFDGTRLRLGVVGGELWKGWCGLLVSYGFNADGSGPPYGCLPNWGYMMGANGCSQPDPSTGKNVPVDCGKLSLCLNKGVCSCSAASCTVDMTAPPDMAFDMQFAANKLDGSIVLPSYAMTHNVHLTRSP